MTLFSVFKPTFFILLLLFILSCNQQPRPQEPDPVRRKSPIAITNIKHPQSKTYVKIVYGQPYKHDRKIFDDLVSYDKVWRTGANEATELTTTGNILFADKKLSAGTYALFTIPHTDGSWTIILNDKLGQWGAFEYDKNRDVMRVDVPAQKTDHTTEVFTILFDKLQNNSTRILLRWDQTEVSIPIEFPVNQSNPS